MSRRLSVFALALLVAALLATSACPGPEVDPDPTPAIGWRFSRVEDVATPGARWGQIPAYTSAGTFIIAGADIDLTDGTGPVLNDVWRVEVDSNTPAFAAVTSDPDAVPRYCGCAAMDEDRNEILVLGGRNQANMVIHDAWIFSPVDGSWTAIGGPLPDGMVGCGAVYIPGESKAYVFGGGSDSFASSATLRFDPGARTFTELVLEGPSARFDHQLRGSSDSSHLWLVSGSLTAITGFSPEVWRFDVASESWSLFDVVGAEPPGRRTPWVAVRDDDRALLMGLGTSGLGPTSDLRDLWSLDLEEGTWAELDVEGIDELGARAFTYFLRAPTGSVGLVYGGTDMEHALDDLWVLDGPDPDVSWH